MIDDKKYLIIKTKIVLLGFGCLGQAIVPLLLRHLQISSHQLIILAQNPEGEEIAHGYGIPFQRVTITKDNYRQILGDLLSPGDFLLNLSYGISSVALINLCQEKKVLYLDTSIEPWDGQYTNASLPPAKRGNYALREEVLPLKGKNSTTAVLTHGANPGLISHLLKQGLWNLACENDFDLPLPKQSSEWAELAKRLEIKAIHIAEHDTQSAHQEKALGEFVNTWSVEGFISEARQPAELGWGTHERHWPSDACQYDFGSKCAIYLNRSGASTKVRSWTPSFGPFHGFLITHAEAISVADYLTFREGNMVSYRPTVHYAYLPCPAAILSIYEFEGNEWMKKPKPRLIKNEVTTGVDELGVLLMGNQKGAYWFGSQLTIEEAHRLAPNNNATSLQVVISILAALIWAFEHPERGVVEPEELDHQFILSIAEPYLGKVSGYFTDWTPLKNRNRLFSENLDFSDPWQFLNIRV